MDDHNGYKVRYFLNVDAADTSEPSSVAQLKSPLMNPVEHAVECVRFYFSMEVRSQNVSLFRN